MKIDNLSQLKKLIALCRKTGVDFVKVDGMEFHLGSQPQKAKRKQDDLVTDPMAFANVPKPQMDLPTPQNSVRDMANHIASEGLTEEQLLFYSSRPEPGQDA